MYDLEGSAGPPKRHLTIWEESLLHIMLDLFRDLYWPTSMLLKVRLEVHKVDVRKENVDTLTVAEHVWSKDTSSVLIHVHVHVYTREWLKSRLFPQNMVYSVECYNKLLSIQLFVSLSMFVAICLLKKWCRWPWMTPFHICFYIFTLPFMLYPHIRHLEYLYCCIQYYATEEGHSQWTNLFGCSHIGR